MRVALVVPGDPDTTSGGFRYDRRLAEGLRAAGDDVDDVAVAWRRYPLGVVDGFRRSPVPAGVDCVLVDELAHPTFVGPTRRRPDVPHVGVVHHLRSVADDSRIPLARRLERRFLRTLDGAVCVSSATERDVAALASLPTRVAPPPADQFDPHLTAREVVTRAHEGPLRVVFLGALLPRKRPRALCSALATLDDPWELTLVGPATDADYARAVRRRIRTLGVDSRVTVAGELPTDDLASVLRESHVMAVPSTYEGFGVAYLEGMAFGLPAVASAAGGAADVVTDGRDGFLVAPDDAGALREALATLSADRERLAEMGVSALARFRRHPEWSETVEEIRAFLREVGA